MNENSIVIIFFVRLHINHISPSDTNWAALCGFSKSLELLSLLSLLPLIVVGECGGAERVEKKVKLTLSSAVGGVVEGAGSGGNTSAPAHFFPDRPCGKDKLATVERRGEQRMVFLVLRAFFLEKNKKKKLISVSSCVYS